MKKQKHILFFCFLFLVSTLLFSTKELPTRAEMIREKVASRMTKFEKVTIDKCTREVMERAGSMVDSILIARARLQVKEVIPKPDIPFRPERPEIKLPKDTTPIVPIFPEGDTSFLPGEVINETEDY